MCVFFILESELMKKIISASVATAFIGAGSLLLGYQAGATHSNTSSAERSRVAMSDSVSRDAIEKTVRDYLIKNPEIIAEAQHALEIKQAEAEKAHIADIIASNKDRLYDPEHDVVFGNPDADVTVIEFFDYNCGYCKRALPDMQAILKNDPNVRFVMKEFPILGPDSMRSHLVAQAFKSMMPEKYAEFHDLLLSKSERATEASAIADAVALGADEKQLRDKMQDPAIRSAFENTYQLASQLNITGTPSYIIGSELIPGAVGAAELIDRIATLRAEAKN